MEGEQGNSSNLRSFGYEPGSSTLEVEFSNGGKYQYFSVPAHIYTGLMTASSKGSYFESHIKKGSFHFIKIR